MSTESNNYKEFPSSITSTLVQGHNDNFSTNETVGMTLKRSLSSTKMDNDMTQHNVMTTSSLQTSEPASVESMEAKNLFQQQYYGGLQHYYPFRPLSLHALDSAGNAVPLPVSSYNANPLSISQRYVPQTLSFPQSFFLPPSMNSFHCGPLHQVPHQSFPQLQQLHYNAAGQVLNHTKHNGMTPLQTLPTFNHYHRLPVSKRIRIEDVRPLFHKSLAEAAQHFGICTTLFKKVCRRLHIKKWPYRQINCLANRVVTLEQCLEEYNNLPEITKVSYKEQIVEMRNKIEKIKDDAIEPEDVMPASLKRGTDSQLMDVRENNEHYQKFLFDHQPTSLTNDREYESVTKSKRQKIDHDIMAVN